MPQAIHISPIDNVVVALHPIAKGTLVEVDGLAVTALEDIPQGHKMAVKPIKNGENVIKYGFPIGTPPPTLSRVPGCTPTMSTPTSPVRWNTAITPPPIWPRCPRWSPRPSWASAARMAAPPSATRSGSSPPWLRQRHRQEDGGRQSGPRHRHHRGPLHLHPPLRLQPDRS